MDEAVNVRRGRIVTSLRDGSIFVGILKISIFDVARVW
jgi:hypothetical protein